MTTQLSELTDEQLAQRVADRSESAAAHQEATQAFEELYRRHAGWLVPYLSARVSRSDLDDYHQSIWQRIWERIPDAFHGGNFRVWLFRIARNFVIDQSRRMQPRLIGEWDALAPKHTGESPTEHLDRQEQELLLRDHLDQLGGQEADIVERRLRGETYDEICKEMSITRSRAYKLLHQAKELLMQAMARAY